MLDGLIVLGVIYFGGLFLAGILGMGIERLAKCKWVDRMLERMIHE